MATPQQVFDVLKRFQRHYPGRFILPATRTAEGKEDAEGMAELAALVADWGYVLRHFTDAVVREASFLVLSEQGDFPPSPEHLVKRCWRLAQPYYPTAGEAWGQIIHELKRGVPARAVPVFTVDLVEQIVTDWGWRAFVEAYSSSEGKEISILQGRFLEEYQKRVSRYTEQLSRTGHEWDLADASAPLMLPQPAEPFSKAKATPAPDYSGIPVSIPGGVSGSLAHMAANVSAAIRDKPRLKEVWTRAKAELEEAWADLRQAKAGGDPAAIREAEARLKYMNSHRARRASQLRYLTEVAAEALNVAPGDPAALAYVSEHYPSLWQTAQQACHRCDGMGLVRVEAADRHLVEYHWKQVSDYEVKGEVVGIYLCPDCQTPTVAQKAAAHAA